MCLPAALASGKSCSQPLEATKLEAWAPGGTFKIPLSGWKIGIFFFFFFGLLPAQNCFFVCSSPAGLMSGSLVVHQSGMRSVLRAAALTAAVQTCARAPSRRAL